MHFKARFAHFKQLSQLFSVHSPILQKSFKYRHRRYLLRGALNTEDTSSHTTPLQEEKQRPPGIAQNLIEWINAILTKNKNRNQIVAFKKKVVPFILRVSQDNFHYSRSCDYSTEIYQVRLNLASLGINSTQRVVSRLQSFTPSLWFGSRSATTIHHYHY